MHKMHFITKDLHNRTTELNKIEGDICLRLTIQLTRLNSQCLLDFVVGEWYGRASYPT